MIRSRQFLSLSSMSAAATVRQPVLLLLTSVCVVVSGMVPLIRLFQFGEEGKLARDSALSLHFFLGLFVVGFAACTALARELNDDTANAALSKPVSRELFFAAKYAGILVIVFLFSTSASLAALLSERAAEKFVWNEGVQGYVLDARSAMVTFAAVIAAYCISAAINYRTNRSFAASVMFLLPAALLAGSVVLAFFDRTGQFSPFSFRFDWRVVNASALVTMALAVIGAVTLALSSRLNTASTLFVVVGLFFMGLVSDWLFGRFADRSLVADLLYRTLPNWQHFWRADDLTGGGRISAVYMLNAALYAALYIAGALSAGILLFRNRELK